MDIKLSEYNGNVTVKNIDDIDAVNEMTITVLSGDEVLDIAYNDGTIEVVDPGMTNRFIDYVDYVYTIYDASESENLIDNPAFMNRKDSYWLSDIWLQ